MSTEVTCIWPIGTELGEGPVWSQAEQALWFVDIEGSVAHRYHPESGARRSVPLPGRAGFAMPCSDGALLLGLPDGLHRFDPASGDARRLLEIEPDLPGNRLNDASVDAEGRLWFGSMDDVHIQPSGSLYCWHRGRLTQHDSGIRITNGPVVSPDGRLLYHTDTKGREVHVFDLAEDGSTQRKRLFLRSDPALGVPDGNAMDVEGCVWVAFFGGSQVHRYAPDGRLLQVVQLPCSNLTKVAFGGPDLRTAYVTSAYIHLTPQAHSEQPLAGALFAFRAPVPGLPTPALVLP